MSFSSLDALHEALRVTLPKLGALQMERVVGRIFVAEFSDCVLFSVALLFSLHCLIPNRALLRTSIQIIADFARPRGLLHPVLDAHAVQLGALQTARPVRPDVVGRYRHTNWPFRQT